MVKKITLGLGVVGIVFAASGIASAATTNVTVSASIIGTCQFDTTPALAFGALDQTSGSDETATGDLKFWCTKNAAYTLSDETNVGVADGAFSGTIADGANSIPYSIAYTNSSGSGAGKTTLTTSTLTATILNAAYVDKPAGDYSGTVTFTITP